MSTLDSEIEVRLREVLVRLYQTGYSHGHAPYDETLDYAESALEKVLSLIEQREVEARLDEAYLIGVLQERGEYLPATYLINRRIELTQPPNKESL